MGKISMSTLQKKYKNIFSSGQPVVVLERCSIAENILLKNSVNSICNAKHTSKLVCSTNHASHQSPYIEQTNNHEPLHNVRDNVSRSLKKTTEKTAMNMSYCSLSDVPSNAEASEDVSQIDKNNFSTGLNKIMKAVNVKTKVDAKREAIQKGKCLQICLHRIVLYNDPNMINISNNSGNPQRNNLNEKIIKLEKCSPLEINKKIKVEPINDRLITNTRNKKVCSSEYLDTMPLQERDAMLHGNYLTKYESECSIKEEDLSSLETRNSCTSTVSLQTKSLEERFIMPGSKQSSKNAKEYAVEHTQKNIAVKETVVATSTPTESSINSSTNTTQFFERLITLHSNDSNRHSEQNTILSNQESIKAVENISKENNVQQDTLHDQQESRNFQKQKRTHSINSTSEIVPVKKIKLNRSTWCWNSEAVNKSVNTSKEVDQTKKIIQLQSNQNISQFIPTDVPRSIVAFSEKDSINNNVQDAKANLTEDRGVCSIGKKNLTETFGYSNKVICNAQEDARKSQTTTKICALQDTATQIHKTVVETTFSVLESKNSNDSSSQYDDDCISLFADPSLMEEYNVSEVPQSQKLKKIPRIPTKEKQYVMTDKVFNNYYKKNIGEFNETYNINYYNHSKTRKVPQNKEMGKNVVQTETSVKPVSLMSIPIPPFIRNVTERFTLHPQKMQMGLVNQPNLYMSSSIFRGFCYIMLRRGTCTDDSCQYKHDFTSFLVQIYNASETRFFETIDCLINNGNKSFLQSFYKEYIDVDTNVTHVLQLLKKLYDSSILRLYMVDRTIKKLITCRVTAKQIVDILATIVDSTDIELITDILRVIINNVATGDVWPTVKPLVTRLNKLQAEIVEIILSDCICSKKHVNDVHENVVCKLDNETLSKLSEQSLLQFNNILTQTQENVKVQETVESTSSGISSPNPLSEPKFVPYTSNENKLQSKVWKNVVFDSNNSVQREESVLLHPIDNIPNPYSHWSRDRFWKFYLNIHSLQEGLKHGDYNHVKTILDRAEGRQENLFTRACYNILRSKVEQSQIHLSKLASLAVIDGATATFCKILINVTIYILADLAKRELWVLALKLLNNIEVILHVQNCLFKFDAVVMMLFCEIYLANRKPLKAFTLLKRSNILYTHRGKWKVHNNEKDDDIRAKIITLLLDMLMDTSLEYAYFLFEFLITDQSNNFYPIDLSHQTNKLVLSLLLKRDYELIISVQKLIDNYNCILHPITYRALISSLVSANLPLAKQLYHSAVLLGIYSTIKFHPTMYIIIKTDWTSEEMYISILYTMQKIFQNIGHAIDSMKQSNFSMYLVFEAKVSNKQRVPNETNNEQYDNEIRKSIKLMKTVLETKFQPHLSMVHSRKGKLQKLSSMSIYRYLKHNQNFMQSF